MRALNREPFIDGIILKSESKMHGVTETKHVTSLKENKVPDSIFLVPAGYKKQLLVAVRSTNRAATGE
jgi:hypothetical protein